MTPYGCHNSERKPSYLVPIRVNAGDILVFATQHVADRASTDCRYDNRKNDKRCEGCKK